MDTHYEVVFGGEFGGEERLTFEDYKAARLCFERFEKSGRYAALRKVCVLEIANEDGLD